jgi:hypothetical protein
MASALRVGVGLSGDEIMESRVSAVCVFVLFFEWTVLDWHLWADENRSVCRTLICSDFCITPKVSEVPRANKTQLSLAIAASRRIVARHPSCCRHDLFSYGLSRATISSIDPL